MTPPDHLPDQARDEWCRVVGEIRDAGLPIGDIDRALLESYCVSFARWREAEAAIAETGAVVRGPNGGAQQNPWLAVSRNAARDMRQCLELLGLTPAKRQKARRAAQESGENLSLMEMA